MSMLSVEPDTSWVESHYRERLAPGTDVDDLTFSYYLRMSLH